MTKCQLCRSANNDELLLGKMHSRRNGCVAVHESCLYLSSNLAQRGSETSNDICCFTLADIKNESQRTQKLKCFYCHKNGANIGCCAKKCRRSFHTECGIKNGAQNQYCHTYNSFCSSHIEKFPQRPNDQEECAICLDTLLKKEKFKYTEHILGNCCNHGWYHKRCLQQYANSAGYFFKCPLCNDKEKFHLVSMWGISVPNRDASWEQTDAYDDQQVLATSCTAENCQLRRENPDESVSEILLYCNFCGGNPMHTQCTPLDTEDYCCNDCNGVANDTIDPTLDDTLSATETIMNLNGSPMKFETMELSMKKEENAPCITPLRPRNCSPSAEHQDSRFRDRNICMTTTDMKGEEKNNENIFLAQSQPMTPVSLRSKRVPITVDKEKEKENSSPILRDQRLGHAMQAALEPKFKNEDQLSDSDIGDDLEVAVAMFKKQEEESRKANQLKYGQMPVSDQRSSHGDQASIESKSEIKDESDDEMGDDIEVAVAMFKKQEDESRKDNQLKYEQMPVSDQRSSHGDQASIESKSEIKDESDDEMGDDIEVAVAMFKKQEEESRKANQLKYGQMPVSDQRSSHGDQASIESKSEIKDESDDEMGDDIEVAVAMFKKQEEESRKANQLKYGQMPVSDQRSSHGDQASIESKSEIKDESDDEMGDDIEIVVAMLNQKKAEADAAREALKREMQWEEDKENNQLTSNTTATQRPSISVEKSTQSSETAIEMRETPSRSRHRLSQDVNVKHVESQPENITVRSRLSRRLSQNPNDELIQAQPEKATVPPMRSRSRLSCRLFPDVNVDHIESQAEKNTVRPSRLRSRLSCRLSQDVHIKPVESQPEKMAVRQTRSRSRLSRRLSQNPNDELIQAQPAKATVPPMRSRSRLSCRLFPDVNVDHIESQAEKNTVRPSRLRSRLSCRLSQDVHIKPVESQPEKMAVPPTSSRSRQRRATIAEQPQQCETMRQTRSRSRLSGSPKDANNVPQPTANRAARLRQRRSTLTVERSAKEKSQSSPLKRQTRSRSALKRKSPTDLGVSRHPMRRRSQHALQPEAMLNCYDVEEQWRSRL